MHVLTIEPPVKGCEISTYNPENMTHHTARASVCM